MFRSQFTEYMLQYYANSLSIIVTLYSLLLFITVSFINNRVNNNIPYLISVFILISDLLYSICQIGFIFIDLPPIACKIYQWMEILSISLSMFYAATISIIFLLAIKYELRLTLTMRVLTYSIAPILSIILSTLPLAFDRIRTADGCGFNMKNNGVVWILATKFGATFITVFICPIIYIVIIYYLALKKRMLSRSGIGSGSNGSSIQYRAFIRLFIYPLIPLISYVFYMVVFIFAIFKIELNKMTVSTIGDIGAFFSGLQGFFNSLLFLTNSIFLKEINQVGEWYSDSSFFDKTYFIKLKQSN
ncbi:hypothetical protein K502DRAFT_352908 [Neoconidiobolus thromboides FSU 785]|nr:hypothetical protein K502DRAFT_352908 [Neoconidiobolus thromboides FSU 785]